MLHHIKIISERENAFIFVRKTQIIVLKQNTQETNQKILIICFPNERQQKELLLRPALVVS